MKTFLGITKPSQALRAMIDGLLFQSQQENFEIDMSSFGSFYETNRKGEKICYGCAATCALQFLGKQNFTPDNIEEREDRADVLKVSPKELYDFEVAVDAARQGMMRDLFEFFYSSVPENTYIFADLLYIDYGLHYEMGSDDWEQCIPMIETHIKLLEKHGY